MASPPNFFVEDGDEDDLNSVGVPQPDTSSPTSEPNSYISSPNAAESPLFLPDGESEPEESPLTRTRVLAEAASFTNDDIEMSEVVEPIDVMKQAKSCPQESAVLEIPRPTKKRKLSTLDLDVLPDDATVFKSAYFGTVVVDNAWSTVKGNSYVKPGDEIYVEWDGKPNDSKSSSTSKKRKTSNGKGKQLSITTMFKAQGVQSKRTKKAQNDMVRLTNKAGFEFARLPQSVASWISRLLETGMIEFRGSTVVDCPKTLQTGMDIVVSLSVYILAKAFESSKPSLANEGPRNLFSEGAETTDEIQLRERKSSLLQLFKAVGLRPLEGSGIFGKNGKVELKPDNVLKTAERSDVDRKNQVKKEVVGDGEEIEVEGDAEDLSENELNMIYKRAQQHDQSMRTAEPSDTFTLTLREYQKQALYWMLSIENGETEARESTTLHPLWSEYLFPSEPCDGIVDLSISEKSFYFNSYSGELGLELPKAERNCKGGILAADVLVPLEMGMGKTIILASLIHTNPTRRPDESVTDDKIKQVSKPRQMRLDAVFNRTTSTVRRPSNTTLVVAPTSLINQWAEELRRCSTADSLDVQVWHGQNRSDLEATLDRSEIIQVVVTSYGVLASEHAKYEKSSKKDPFSVFEIEWLRVVLDEAHHCKSRISNTAKAVYALKSCYRWCVTGTPLVNRLEDIYSLLKFIDFVPWSNYSFFRSFITIPFLARDPKAIEIMQVILESVLLRRQKDMRDRDGKLIVELPSKEVVVEHLQFSNTERRLYDSIYLHAKRNFERLNEKGLVGKNYTHILSMLMRLRRAVLHPHLVLSQDQVEHISAVSNNEIIDVDGSENSTYAENVLNNLAQTENEECPMCLDILDSPVIQPCMHKCCKDCIVGYIESCREKGQEGRCPICSNGPLKESDLLELVKTEASPSQPSAPQKLIVRRNDFTSSTKLDALIRDLRRLRDQDPTFRAVVFSQFTGFLDIIGVGLQRENFPFTRFDGSMDIKKRQAAISEFKAPSRKPMVLLLSLKAGGVGLNLSNANHAFMLDAWWNRAVEDQAIDRIHRIGQLKTVYVKHFIISDTIEERILQIQKRKTAIIKEAFKGKNGNEDPESVDNLKIMFGMLDG